MLVTKLVDAKAANAAFTSAIIHPAQYDLGQNPALIVWARATANPASQGVDVRVEGRPDSSAEWYQIRQLLGGTTGWFQIQAGTSWAIALTGTVILPQMRLRLVAVGGSTNVLHMWVSE